MASRIAAAPARITTTAARSLSLTTRQIIESREKPPDRRPIPDTTGAPILLYDRVTVPSNGEQPFKSKALMNNRNRRIQLHELRVVCTVSTASIGHVMPTALIILQLAVKRKSGKSIPITRGYVPILGICKSTNRLGEVFGGLFSFVPTSTIGGNVWKFSYPIDLAPGDFIEAQAKNTGLFDSPVTVDLSFAGADAADLPSYRIPYVASWQSRDFAYSEAAVDSAPPDELVNDLKADFHIDRIIGRFLSRSNFPAVGSEIADFSDLSNQAALSASLRMGTAQNRPILRAYATFRSVFGQVAAVETDFLLAPGDYLLVDVQHAAGPTLFTPFTYFFGRAIVSLVGWREVA